MFCFVFLKMQIKCLWCEVITVSEDSCETKEAHATHMFVSPLSRKDWYAFVFCPLVFEIFK